MKAYVNDFLTVNAGVITPPDTAIQYVNISGYNSVIIVNSGLRPFRLTGRSFTIFAFQKFVIEGKEFENLMGNLYIEFNKGFNLAQATFIRKKYIHNAKL